MFGDILTRIGFPPPFTPTVLQLLESRSLDVDTEQSERQCQLKFL